MHNTEETASSPIPEFSGNEGRTKKERKHKRIHSENCEEFGMVEKK